MKKVLTRAAHGASDTAATPSPGLGQCIAEPGPDDLVERADQLAFARMTDMGDVAFTLHVDGDRDERLRRLASGVLALSPNARISRAFFSLSGAVFVVLGLATFVNEPIAGIVLPALGIFLIGKCGSRRAAIRRLAARYGRCRFITEPTSYVLASTGLRSTSDTSEASWAWRRVAEVREHEDGLLVVFDGQLSMIDLPPSAFVTADRDSVARHAAHWIAAAPADSPAGAS